jgi:hypothetical protein
MCINVGSHQQNISLEKTNKNEVKINPEIQEISNEDNIASTLEVNYNLDVDNQYKESGHAATTISFEDKEPITNISSNKLDAQEMKIVEFISLMKDKTMQSVLDSFDRMLENSRRMREENNKFFKDVTQPKEQALKKAMLQQQMLEEKIN